MNDSRNQRRKQEADDWLRKFDEDLLRERESHKHRPADLSSGFNREALKQAIEDAKQVRLTALRNARQALEDAFSKRFEEVFKDKLSEEGLIYDENKNFRSEEDS